MSPLRSTRFLSSPILRLVLLCCWHRSSLSRQRGGGEGRGGSEWRDIGGQEDENEPLLLLLLLPPWPWRPPSEVPLAPVAGAEVVVAALSPKPSGMGWDGRRAGWLVGDRPDLASHPRCIKRLDDYRILSPVIHVDLTPPFMFMTNFIENGNIVGRLCTLNLRSY